MQISLTSSLRYLKISLVYFLLVFGVGFILGPIRILWLVPRVGVRTAELIELPIMIAVTIAAARWLVRRFNLLSLTSRLVIGCLALAFLLGAEFAVAVGLRGMSVSDVMMSRDPISGTAYFISLAAFALMPSLVSKPH